MTLRLLSSQIRIAIQSATAPDDSGHDYQVGWLTIRQARPFFQDHIWNRTVVRLSSTFYCISGKAAAHWIVAWVLARPEVLYHRCPPPAIPCPDKFEAALWTYLAAKEMHLKGFVLNRVRDAINAHIDGPKEKFLSGRDFKLLVDVDLAFGTGEFARRSIIEVIVWHNSNRSTALSQRHLAGILALDRENEIRSLGAPFEVDAAAGTVNARLLGWRMRAKSVGDIPCETSSDAERGVRDPDGWGQNWLASRTRRRP